ncbi:MAG: hypothetical protein ABR567_14770 [Myxococcales bacterium]|nr:hypothetical protein [Myxococcales bacterium]
MKMIRVLSIAVAGALCATPALADPMSNGPARGSVPAGRDANNSFFVEGGGPGLLYSLNYERIVENDFGLRVGFSYTSFSASASSGGSTASASAAIITVPVIASYLGVSSGSNALEMGAGGTLVYASGSASGTGLASSGSGMMGLGTVILGYRRQPVDGGFQFRIGLEALVGKGLSLSNPDPNSFGVLPWMYMSLGFSL